MSSAAAHESTGPATENLQEWLRATTEAINRSRRTLLIASVVGILVFVSTFNLYFTWLRDILARGFNPDIPEQKAMFENAMRIRFSDTAVTSIPFLGIRIFSGDINLVGAVAVNVVIVWMASAFQKSNHALGRLLQRAGLHYRGGKPVIPANSHKTAPSTYLYHVLSSEYLFVGSKSNDLASRLMTCRDPSRRSRFQVIQLIPWLPALSLMFAFSADLMSMFFESVLVPMEKSVSAATVDDLWPVRIVAIPLVGLIYAVIKTAETAAYAKDSQQLFEHLGEAVEPHWQQEVALSCPPVEAVAARPG